MAIAVSYETDTFGQTNKQVARIRYRSTVPFSRVLEEAAGGSLHAELQMREAFDLVTSVIVSQLAEGHRVKTPIGTFGVGLRRESQALEHEGLRNTIGANEPSRTTVTPGRLKMVFRADRGVMKRLRGEARLERVTGEGPKVPSIVMIEPLERDRTPDGRIELAPDELVRLKGYELAFAAGDVEQGVFLVSEVGDHGETRATAHAHVGPREVTIKCPHVGPGRYRVVVRTRPTGTSVRQGVSDEVVEVVEG